MPRATALHLERFRDIDGFEIHTLNTEGNVCWGITESFLRNLSSFQGYTAYTAMYDRYRMLRLQCTVTLAEITKIVTTEPLVETIVPDTEGPSCILCWVQDMDDANELDGLKMQEHRYRSKVFSKLGQTAKITMPISSKTPVVPIDGSTVTNGGIRRKPWIDMAEAAVEFGCAKVVGYTLQGSELYRFKFLRRWSCDFAFATKR